MALPLLHPIIIVPPPLQLVQFPPGTYRVSFNLITHSIEDAPLNETIYARIQQCLQQVLHYHHTQNIDPLGIIFAVLSRMQMFYIPFPADMIATNNICLGDIHCPLPLSPVPMQLIPPHVPALPVPGHPNYGFW
ncbi:hypothetical protein AcV5_010431 [Taiwanofungus camphoratus]|nr:hypothetical protein AcV5_010431 [Antrodia cinnamomea]